MAYVYSIINLVNQKIYIGSTKNIEQRKKRHFNDLRLGKHHNIYLQRAFNKYGEDSFLLEILEECPDGLQFEQEQYNIDFLSPEYNIGSVGGGDNLTNHPNRETIIKARTEAQRLAVSKMTPEERKKRWGRYRETNPNWKGGKTFCDCGNRKKAAAKTCSGCRDRSGENNPFFGKQHTEETKKRLSELAKNREMPSNAKKIICEGIMYTKIKTAAEVYGISSGAMTYRLKSTANKWKEFYYCQE